MRVTSSSGPHSRQRGLSLVELMVGITVGMIVVAGASLMMTNQITEHRRLVLETQVQQDLRAAADLMLRDLRRVGFWATHEDGVWASGASAAASSPYGATTPAQSSQDETEVLYNYSRGNDYTSRTRLEDNRVTNDEAFGFKVSNGVLHSLLGGTWQPLTDPNTLTIKAFSVKLTVQPIDLKSYCATPCPVGSTICPPELQVRRFDIVINGAAKDYAEVERTISVSSRLRNDRIVGSCPT